MNCIKLEESQTHYFHIYFFVLPLFEMQQFFSVTDRFALKNSLHVSDFLQTGTLYPITFKRLLAGLRRTKILANQNINAISI